MEIQYSRKDGVSSIRSSSARLLGKGGFRQNSDILDAIKVTITLVGGGVVNFMGLSMSEFWVKVSGRSQAGSAWTQVDEGLSSKKSLAASYRSC